MKLKRKNSSLEVKRNLSDNTLVDNTLEIIDWAEGDIELYSTSYNANGIKKRILMSNSNNSMISVGAFIVKEKFDDGSKKIHVFNNHDKFYELFEIIN